MQEGRVSAATAVALSPPPAATPEQCFQLVGKHQLLILEMRNRLLVVDALLCFIAGAVLFFAPAFTANLIFGLILTLLILIHCSAVTPNLIYPEYLRIAKYWWTGWLAANLLLQTAHRWTVGETMNKENILGNILYQLDSLASLAIGAAWLAFPKWLLHRQVSVQLDESHEICARLMGAYFLTSYVISTHALHWNEPSERLVAVDSRALICTMILIAQVWSQYAYSEHWNGTHWVGISLFSSWTIIAILYRCYVTMKVNGTGRKAKKLQ